MLGGAADRSVCGAAERFWDKVAAVGGEAITSASVVTGRRNDAAIMGPCLSADRRRRSERRAINSRCSRVRLSADPTQICLRCRSVSAHKHSFSSQRSLGSTGVISMLLHPAQRLTTTQTLRIGRVRARWECSAQPALPAGAPTRQLV